MHKESHTLDLEKLPSNELLVVATDLQKQVSHYEHRMLNKKEVARMLGMTVSWLNNSQSDTAVKIRASGVRYGRSHTSPVRYPLRKIAALCCADEC